MNDLDDILLDRLRVKEESPPFTPQMVRLRYDLALIRRQARRRAQLVISGVALVGALLAFLFLNINGEIGPGFFDPTLVRAATPFPTLISTPYPPAPAR
jgi:hypothetical protein